MTSLEILPVKRRLLKRFGRHSVGVWIGGEWNGDFPESKNVFQSPLKFRRKSGFDQIFQAPNFENSEPEKKAIPYPQPFHTPTDSLLVIGFLCQILSVFMIALQTIRQVASTPGFAN